MIKVITATQNPIQFIGKVSGVCYGSKDESSANYKRGKKCIDDEHGRVMEYVDITFVVDEVSARVMREFMRHAIGCSYLQASTRYITYDNFSYYTPEELKYNEEYHSAMNDIIASYNKLVDSGIKKEHVANILPLGMETKVVVKMNLRALIHMANVRMCERAYIEYRDLMKEMIKEFSKIDQEWKELMSYMKPKCATCTERHNCPRLKNKGEN